MSDIVKSDVRQLASQGVTKVLCGSSTAEVLSEADHLILKRTAEPHGDLSALHSYFAGLRGLQDRLAADRITQQGGEGKRDGLECHRPPHAPERPGHVPSTLGDTVEDREAARGADRRGREASEEAQALGNRRRTRPYTSTLEQKTNGQKTNEWTYTRTDLKEAASALFPETSEVTRMYRLRWPIHLVSLEGKGSRAWTSTWHSPTHKTWKDNL